MASQAAIDLVIGLKDNASAGLGKITDSLGTVGRLAGGLALGGIAALGAGIAGTAAVGLGFNNSMEQASARINAFTKDADATAEILEMVRERAAKTPFAFEDMANAAAALGPAAKQSGVPLVDLIAQAEILAASNPAEGFEGAVFSLKEALSGDFLSIIERFNLPKQRLKELKDQGVPAIEAIRIAMAELGLDSDLVSNMANTASGRWSTLVDTFTTLAASITAPIFEGVSKGMGDLQVLLDANMPKLESFAATLGEKVGAAMGWLASTGIPMLISGFETVSGIISAIVTPLMDAYNAFQLWSNFTGTIGGIQAALQSIGESIPALEPITSWLSAILPGAVEIARNAIALVQEGFTVAVEWLTTNVPPALEAVRLAWETLSLAFQDGGVTGVLSLFLETITNIIPGLEPLTSWLQSVLPEAVNAAQTAINIVVERFQAWWSEFGNLQTATGVLSDAVGILSSAWDTFNTALAGVITTIQNSTGIQAVLVGVIGAIAAGLALSATAAAAKAAALLVLNGAVVITNGLLAIMNGILAANPIGLVIIAVAGLAAGFIYLYKNSETFRAEVDRLWASFQRGLEVIQTWAAGVKERWDAMVGDFKRGWTTIETAASTAWDTIKTAVTTAFTTIVTTVSGKIDEVIAFFTELPGRITGALGNLGSLLVSAGTDLIQGLINGVKSIDVGSILGGIVTGAISSAKAAVGIKSPSTMTREELGKPLMQGLILGISDETPAVKKALVQGVTESVAAAKETAQQSTGLGQGLMQGLIQGITEKAPEVKKRLETSISDTLGAIKQILKTADFTGEIGRILGMQEDDPFITRLLDMAKSGGTKFLAAIESVLKTADFTGEIGHVLGMQEDDPFITKLLDMAKKTGQTVVDGIAEGIKKNPLPVKQALLQNLGDGKFLTETREKAKLLGVAVKQGIAFVFGQTPNVIKQALLRNLGDPSMLPALGEKAQQLGREIKEKVRRGFMEQTQEFLDGLINLGDPKYLQDAQAAGAAVGSAYVQAMADAARAKAGSFIDAIADVANRAGGSFGSGSPSTGGATTVSPPGGAPPGQFTPRVTASSRYAPTPIQTNNTINMSVDLRGSDLSLDQVESRFRRVLSESEKATGMRFGLSLEMSNRGIR